MTICALLPFLLGSLAEDPSRADWHCRNDFEVRCNDGTCIVVDRQESSTMDVSFNYSGEFSVCAYSGCWSGTGSVLSTSPFFVISKQDAEWSFQPNRKSNAENVLIAFDPKDKVASVKVGGFVHPFTCTSGDSQSGD